MLSSLRLGRLAVVLASLQAVALAHPKCGGCAADECFTKASLPAAYSPTLSSFCYGYLSSTTATSTITATVTVTDTATDSGVVTLTATQTVTDSVTTTETAINTATAVFTPSPVPGTVTETETETTTSTVTSGTTCQVTSTATIDQYPTSVFFKVRGTPGASVSAAPDKRSLASYVPSPAIPTELSRGCKPDSLPAKLSAACSCVLQSATPALTTVTVTATQFATTAVTNTASVTGTASITEVTTVTDTATETITETTSTAAPETVTVTTTTVVLTTTEPCTSTATDVTTTVGAGASLSCGVATATAPASGSITCGTVVATQASEQAIYFRIEGGDQGTVFDDCLAVGPGDLTTSSGGTHQCGNSNSGNLNRAIQSAAGKAGFSFDGSFSPSFNDYFITRIAADAQSGNQYWGVLNNGVFTTSGGCGASVQPEDRGLWQWDAFRGNLALLTIEPQYMVVSAKDTTSVTVKVNSRSPNGGGYSAASGAIVANTYVADSNGDVTIPVLGPGCYQYKAERSNSGRSNTFYLSVLE